MKQNCCFVCKIVNLLVVIGALNWGLIGVLRVDAFARFLSGIPKVTRLTYILIGLAGLMKLISCFKACPCCKSSCETKS